MARSSFSPVALTDAFSFTSNLAICSTFWLNPWAGLGGRTERDGSGATASTTMTSSGFKARIPLGLRRLENAVYHAVTAPHLVHREDDHVGVGQARTITEQVNAPFSSNLGEVHVSSLKRKSEKVNSGHSGVD